MNKIYRKASTVWVWFGVAEHQDRIPEAIRFFGLIADEDHRTKHDEVPLNIDHVKDRTGQSMYRDSALLSAVLHILSNDWSRRVWVVQEATLATNLRFLCGEHEINRFDLEDAAYNADFIGTLYGAYGQSLDLSSLTPASDLFCQPGTFVH
jgi:hypothetical protein